MPPKAPSPDPAKSRDRPQGSKAPAKAPAPAAAPAPGDPEHRSKLRTKLLGEDADYSNFDQARREARLIGNMESQGEAPTRIVSQLNEQLSGTQDAQFKSLLSGELKPQLDRLAGQVHLAPTEDRRKLAGLVARAAHLAGRESASTFAMLLEALASAEAKHLATSAGAGPVICAAEFESALRRAASPAYRTTLVKRGLTHLESLSREAMQLPAEDLHSVLVSLLGAAGVLSRSDCTALAKCVLTGALAKGKEAAGRLGKALVAALAEVPAGCNWVVRVMLDLVERGDMDAAQTLGTALQQHFREARVRCGPLLRTVQTAADKNDQLEQSQKLDEVVGPLAGLMPGCALVLAARGQVPGGGSGPLVTEALLAMASLDAVGATPTGQKLLRTTLIMEEQGEPSFLGIVPVTSVPLGHPQIIKMLGEAGLFVPHYQGGGSLFIQRVARQVFRALSGTVVARSQKGENEEARKLLYSAITNNTPLFGMHPNGGRLAADMIEQLRSNPQPAQAAKVLADLEALAKRHPSPYRTGYVESLRGLLSALAERDPLAAPKNKLSAGPKMTASQAERTHIVNMQAYEAQRAEREAQKAAAAKAAAEAAAKAAAKAPKPLAKPASGAAPAPAGAPAPAKAPAAPQKGPPGAFRVGTAAVTAPSRQESAAPKPAKPLPPGMGGVRG